MNSKFKTLTCLKILSINIALFFGIILFIEVAYRSAKFAKNCFFRGNCSGYLFTLLPIENKHGDLNLSVYDKDLGYIPDPNFKGNLNILGWKNVYVSHEGEGIRTSSINYNANISVLTVGDSFAYGWQVPDSDTWQSCLNKKKSNFNFINAGVPGYGTAQSLLRANKLFKKLESDILLVQVLVGSDLSRDQFKFKWGLLRPYFTKSKSDIHIRKNEPLPQNTPGTKYGPTTAKTSDYIFTNLTFLDQIPKLKQLRHDGISRITKAGALKAQSPASKEEILDWSINLSESITSNNIWILQYWEDLNADYIQSERSLIVERLKSRGIPVIDTFNSLNDYKQNNPEIQAWNGHHTKEGNEIVCNLIFKDFSRHFAEFTKRRFIQ